MRAVSQASSQRWRYIDADVWCKQALNDERYEKIASEFTLRFCSTSFSESRFTALFRKSNNAYRQWLDALHWLWAFFRSTRIEPVEAVKPYFVSNVTIICTLCEHHVNSTRILCVNLVWTLSIDSVNVIWVLIKSVWCELWVNTQLTGWLHSLLRWVILL